MQWSRSRVSGLLSAQHGVVGFFYLLLLACPPAALSDDGTVAARGDAESGVATFPIGSPDSIPNLADRPLECHADGGHAPFPHELPPVSSTAVTGNDCLVSTRAFRQALENPDAVVVDIRNPEDYRRFHIEGSLNIPLHAIKTKAFLKERRLLLVGDVVSDVAIRVACEHLANEGFAGLSALDGGMPSWVLGKGEIVGSTPHPAELLSVSPAQHLAAEGERPWLVVSDEGLSKQADIVLAAYGAIAWDGSPKDMATRLGKMRQADAADRQAGLLLLGSSTITAAVVDELAQLLPDRRMRYMEDGTNAYRSFLNIHAAQQQRRPGSALTSKRCKG